MEQYIPKSVVVAEIEKLKGQLLRGACSSQINMVTSCKEEAYNEVLSCLDTFEVKEVDLDFHRFAKEMQTVFALPSSKTENTQEEPLNWEYAIAKHFFELGIKASNTLTWEDINSIDHLLFDIKEDYDNGKLDKEKYYKEVLKKFKAQL